MSHTHYSITDLTHDGRGVAKHDGKTVFIADAIPGDQVTLKGLQSNKTYDEAVCHSLVKASSDRAEPFCEYYEKCGGCQLQHMQIDAQRQWKQAHFLEALSKKIDTTQMSVSEPLLSEDTGYRRRAKFFVGRDKTDKLPKVGFRAKASHDLVDIEACPMVSESMNQALKARRPELLDKASRNIQPLMLIETEQGIVWSDDKITNHGYQLQDLNYQFPTTGFIQVNADINRQMIAKALDWLSLESHHQVLDLFCGVGNFTLPIAQKVQQVVGIEGDADLVDTAKRNSVQNGLDNAAFYKADLFQSVTGSQWFKKQTYHRVLLDPGRLGAKQICEQLGRLKPEIIVYVSCNPSTLVRDLTSLQKQGYQIKQSVFMDMFPHTTHAELMVQLVYSAKLANKKPKRKIFKM